MMVFATCACGCVSCSLCGFKVRLTRVMSFLYVHFAGFPLVFETYQTLESPGFATPGACSPKSEQMKKTKASRLATPKQPCSGWNQV